MVVVCVGIYWEEILFCEGKKSGNYKVKKKQGEEDVE